MKIALGVEYRGGDFHGWQMQKSTTRTVQQVVENALAVIANHDVRVFCAGRTDSGVHAIEQVIHFETDTVRADKDWLFGGNANLPDDVNFKWAKSVDDSFHARFSAIARQYHYVIFNHPARSSLNSQIALWVPQKLDVELMQIACQHLLGKHDFSAFRAQNCQAKSPIKTIEKLAITQTKNHLKITIKADAFLQQMVRNIVGSLLKIGKGEKPPEWLKTTLSTKQRKLAGPTAKPHALYFTKVFYPPNILS